MSCNDQTRRLKTEIDRLNRELKRLRQLVGAVRATLDAIGRDAARTLDAGGAGSAEYGVADGSLRLANTILPMVGGTVIERAGRRRNGGQVFKRAMRAMRSLNG